MKILISGDFCPRFRGAKQIEDCKYEASFSQIKEIVKTADYSITNLECPVVLHEAKPIVKMGPNLKCTSNVGKALKYIGFDCLTLANNHIMDFGKQGLIDTLEFCNRENFDIVGVGLSEEQASQTKYINTLEKTLAIINCCEFEFSIAQGDLSGAHHLNPIHQYNEILEARQHADYVIIIIHGGHEHWQLPSPRMVETYRFFVDAGADAVINHHQHCYSGYEVYKGKPIFYGLGNFYFDIKPIRIDDKWNYGYMVVLYLDDNIKFDLVPYKQCTEEPVIELLDYAGFENEILKLNEIIQDRNRLYRMTCDYYEACKMDSAIVFEPVQNRYFNGFQYRKLLPLLRTKKGLRLLYNFILCEAHRDKLQYYLTKEINNQQ